MLKKKKKKLNQKQTSLDAYLPDANSLLSFVDKHYQTCLHPLLLLFCPVHSFFVVAGSIQFMQWEEKKENSRWKEIHILWQGKKNVNKKNKNNSLPFGLLFPQTMRCVSALCIDQTSPSKEVPAQP